MSHPPTGPVSDNRPTETWQDRLGPALLLIIAPLWFAGLLLLGVYVLLLLAWGAGSPVLPRRWRINWETAFSPSLDPSINAQCPACQGRLLLGPVGSVVVGQSDQGNEDVRPAQTAMCPRCDQAFRRLGAGKVWKSWRVTP